MPGFSGELHQINALGRGWDKLGVKSKEKLDKSIDFHSPQVSSESSSGTFVYQGFVRGKGFGQFGLQRLGKIPFFALFPSIPEAPCKYFALVGVSRQGIFLQPLA